MHTTTIIDNNKNFESELLFIEKICFLDKYIVNHIGSECKTASLSRQNKSLNFEIKQSLEKEQANEDKILFVFDNIILITKTIGNTSSSTHVEVNKCIDFKTIFELKEFHSEDFGTNGKFKSVLQSGFK